MRAVVAVPVVAGALLVAFFLTFNSLFSDGPRDPLHPERLVVETLILGLHGGLAAIGARWGGDRWWTWALRAAGPSVVIALLYGSRETGILGLAVLAAALAATGAVAGAWLGRRRATALAPSA